MQASQAIGYLLGMMALPMIAGPPIAGEVNIEGKAWVGGGSWFPQDLALLSASA